MSKSDLLQIFRKKSIPAANDMPAWDMVLKNAKQHKVEELLLLILKEVSKESVPKTVLAYLEKQYLRTLGANLCFMKETEIVATNMRNSGIPSIVLKGAILALRLYDDPGVRRSWDIDIMVEEDNLKKAVDVLGGMGYKYVEEEEDASWDNEFNHHVKLGKVTSLGQYFVELHFSFTHRSNKFIKMQDIWKRALTAGDNQSAAQQLAPMDLLIHLCLHSAGHNFEILRHVLDVCRIIEKEEHLIDWPEFTRLVKEYHITHRVFASLNFAAIMFSAPVPSSVLEDIKPSGYIRYLLERECRPEHLPQKLSFITSGLVRNEGLSGFLVSIWRILFPPVSQMRKVYNVSVLGACIFYPIRFFTFVFKTVFYFSYILFKGKVPYTIRNT